MKAYIFFVEDEKKFDEHTDFKTKTGYYDLVDLTKNFKYTILNYNQPYGIFRKVEALNMLCNITELTLNSEVIKERLNI